VIFIWKSAIFLGEQWFNNGLTMVNDGLSGGLSGGLYIYRYLVGGAVTILKNIFVRKNGKDDPIYEMESRKSHVPNHQPVIIQCIVGFSPNFSKKPI
jgi:hypothetical protein